jgi:hypothetical protein
MNTDTPRTDWVEARVWDRYKQAEDILPEDNAKAAIREACDFARTLERELAEAKAERDDAHTKLGSVLFKLPHDILCGDVRKWYEEHKAERDALRIEYESRAIWIAKLLPILGCENKDGFNCCDVHKVAAELVAKHDQLLAEVAELRAWKAGKKGVEEYYQACAERDTFRAELQQISDILPKRGHDTIGAAKDVMEDLQELRAEVERLKAEAARQDAIADNTVAQRDAAEEAADKLASLILGEPIDWPFHDAKWKEAIEAATGLRAEVERLSGVKNQLERTGFTTITQLADAWLSHKNTFKSQTAYVEEVEAREAQLRTRVAELEKDKLSSDRLLVAAHEELKDAFETLGNIGRFDEQVERLMKVVAAIDAARVGEGKKA